MDDVIQGYVRGYAFKLYGHCREYDDILQDGMIGAWEAERRFDSSYGCKLSTFVLHRAKGAMIDGIRSRKPGKRSMDIEMVSLVREATSFYSSTGADHIYNDEPEERFTGDDELLYELTKHELVACCKDDVERYIVDNIIQGKSYVDIAKDLGVTQSAISCRLRSIRSKLRERLAA